MNTEHGGGSSTTAAPPLIDVDCNLIHTDMQALGQHGLVTSSSSNNDNKELEQESPASPWKNVVQHPSVSNANIVAMFSPSSTLQESDASVKAFKLYKHEAPETTVQDIKTSAGVHPYHAAEEGHPQEQPQNDSDNTHTETTPLDRLESLLKKSPSCLACVGECGLDYSPGFPPASAQRPWFDVQLDLAYKYKLPVFLHERLAFEETLQALDAAQERHATQTQEQHTLKVMVHCFTGTVAECQTYVQRGYYVGITGYIFKGGKNKNDDKDGPEVVRQCLVQNVIPLDKLVIETDAPYMGFQGCREEYLQVIETFKADVANQEEGALSSLSPLIAKEVHDMSNLNAKKRKRLATSIYPNVPASLTKVLTGVTEALNEGRKQRGQETLLTEEEVAWQCTRNAVDFFGFKLDI